MRPATRLTLVVLFALLLATALYQLTIAGPDNAEYPGPVPGTPLPTASAD